MCATPRLLLPFAIDGAACAKYRIHFVDVASVEQQ
jgi:hypothetical protein